MLNIIENPVLIPDDELHDSDAAEALNNALKKIVLLKKEKSTKQKRERKKESSEEISRPENGEEQGESTLYCERENDDIAHEEVASSHRNWK